MRAAKIMMIFFMGQQCDGNEVIPLGKRCEEFDLK
jgi:hypothetical protein